MSLPPIESILKYYGEENKKQREDLVNQVKYLKFQLEEEKRKHTMTPPNDEEELRKEVEDLKEKLKTVNEAMNSINRVVSQTPQI